MIHHDQPTEIKGAYFITEEDSLIDVLILDPDNNLVFKRTAEQEGMIEFNTTRPGQYTFIFSNLGDKVYQKSVTFALNTQEVVQEPSQFDFALQTGDVIPDEENAANETDLASVAQQLHKSQK